MKIAVVSNGNIPSHYANSINTMRHANAFKGLGNEVLICSVLRLKEHFFLKEIDDIHGHYNISRIPIKFFNDRTLFFFNTRFFELMLAGINKLNFLKKVLLKSSAEKRISKYLKTKNYDFVYSRSYYTTIYNLRYGIPTVIETHAASPNKINELSILSKENFDFLLGIVTIHEKIKLKLIKMGFPKEKILVREDAVQESFFNKNLFTTDEIKNKLNIQKHKKVITYIGSLKRGKGIKKIVEISKALVKRKDIIFNIVGGSKEEISSIIKEYSPYSNLIFSGFQKGKDIPDFLAISNLLLLLYDPDESKPVMDYSTTSPVKLFEYMSAGKPILASKLKTIEKIVDYRDDILIYEQNNVNDQVEQIINNPNKYVKYGKNSKNHAKKFTYKKRAKTIIECLIK